MPPTSSLVRLADIVVDPGKLSMLLYLKLPPEKLSSVTSDQI